MAEWETMRILKAAHVVGQQRMDDLERATAVLGQGGMREAVEIFDRVLEFMEGELSRHFDHEERALFPVIVRIIGRGGPVGAMEGEHESLWRCIDDFADALTELKTDVDQRSIQAKSDISRMAKHIAWSLRGHIQREDTMLFPLAEKTLDERGKLEVDANLRTVDLLAKRR